MKRHFLKILFGIVLLALLLRLIVCSELCDTGAVASPLAVTDMATYKRLASEILHGHWPAFFDYQPLYYTLFLPAATLFSPDGGIWGPMILQCLTGAFTVYLTGMAAARLFGRRGGLIAALLLALSQYHIFYTPYLLLEVLFGFWLSLVFYLCVQAMSSKTIRWGYCAAIGCVLSLAALTRGSALLWSPGILLVLLWHFRAQNVSAGRLVAGIAVAVVCYIAVQAPYAIHNSRAMGHFCGASVAGGKVLVLGNSPEAPAAGLEYPRTYYQWVDEAAHGGTGVLANILQWAAREPGAFTELTLRKLFFFWERNEIPNNISFIPHADQSRVLHLPILLPWSILGTMALAYLLCATAFQRHHRRVVLLVVLAASFWVATSAFYLLARFRVGFIPLQCIAAAGMCNLCWTKARRIPKNRRVLYSLLLPLLCSFYVVNILPGEWRQAILPSVYRHCRPNGLSLSLKNGTVVLYDHGALCDGGQLPLGIPQNGMVITKHFSASIPDKAAARLLQRVAVPGGAINSYGITIAINGRRIAATPRLIYDRFAQWLCWEIPQWPAGTNGDIIELTIRPSSDVAAVIVDTTRNYGRTRLADEPLPAEAVMEVEWQPPTKEINP